MEKSDRVRTGFDRILRPHTGVNVNILRSHYHYNQHKIGNSQDPIGHKAHC